jgi:DNA modification methylase
MAFRTEVLAEGITCILGDCRDVLPTLGKVDAVVTDPPYGIGFKYESHVDDPGSYSGFLWPIIEAAEALVIDGGPIFVWQAQEWMPRFGEIFPRKWRVMIAAKNFVQLRTTVMQYAYDPVVVWWKPGAKLWRSESGSTYVNRDWYLSNTALHRLENQHPCPRPDDVCKFIVANWIPRDYIILDPFMGSGTIGVAAVKLGRKFIGIEIEPKYFDIACRRISEALKQPDLFIEQPPPAKQETWLDMWSRPYSGPHNTKVT